MYMSGWPERASSKEDLQCLWDEMPISHYDNCDYGTIGAGANCECMHHECRIAYMRRYLPSKELLGAQGKQKECGKALARRLQNHVIKSSKLVKSRGYPVDVDCEKMDAWVQTSIEEKLPNLCSRSLGKFLRYISILVFYEYSSFLPGQNNHHIDLKLLEVFYPRSWRSVRDISDCESENGWNCLFESNLSPESTSTADDQTIIPDELVRMAFERLINSRRMDDDLIQILLYGLLLNTISRSSSHVETFKIHHLYNSEADLDSFFSNNEDVSRPHGYSVSMHVRHGDSCDYYILKEMQYYETKYLHGPKYDRPCFSIDMYMNALRELHAKYGVTTVYLATDSIEMIQRTKIERGFKWIYLEFSRDIFDYKKGWVDFYNDNSLEEVALSAAADLDLLKQGDIFLGKICDAVFITILYTLLIWQEPLQAIFQS